MKKFMIVVPLLALAMQPTHVEEPPWRAATEDLGKGFAHHGVATPLSNHRGIVATADGQGRNVVLLWLYDRRGGYALLMIDAETGKSEQFPMPFNPGGDWLDGRIYFGSGSHLYSYKVPQN